jgi:hypothetical protein
LGGDFNIITKLEERVGGNPVQMAAIDDFKSCISDCAFLQLPSAGPKFT